MHQTCGLNEEVISMIKFSSKMVITSGNQTCGLNEVISTIKFSSKMVITSGNHEHRV